ncbi:MAG: hypothetical protein MJ156_01945 [Alphaproteobacteria bacterium]|nr:hypothetical protein [Alphaproteobacteria bacterium]
MVNFLTDFDECVDAIYDKNFNPIDFDYKKMVRIAYRINNKDPKAEELKKILENSIKKIPEGVYYRTSIKNKNELIPVLIFMGSYVLVLSRVYYMPVPQECFSYFLAFDPLRQSNGHTYVAFSKTFYAMGEDMGLATKNLELKIFDRFRSQILNMEKRGIKR